MHVRVCMCGRALFYGAVMRVCYVAYLFVYMRDDKIL